PGPLHPHQEQTPGYAGAPPGLRQRTTGSVVPLVARVERSATRDPCIRIKSRTPGYAGAPPGLRQRTTGSVAVVPLVARVERSATRDPCIHIESRPRVTLALHPGYGSAIYGGAIPASARRENAAAAPSPGSHRLPADRRSNISARRAGSVRP